MVSEQSYIQGPPDSSGKMIRTWKRTVGANELHEQEVALLDTSGNRINAAKEDGNLASIKTNTDNFPRKATSVTIYNVTMTNANTEYSQALPSNCKKFLIHTRDGTAFRLAFVTGKVATPTEPYFTLPANSAYWEDLIQPSSLTLYFACASSGKTVEIVAWS